MLSLSLWVPGQGLACDAGHWLSLSLWVPGQGLACDAGHWLSLSLWAPGQGLACDAGHWLWEDVSNPSPASLKDLIVCWLLLGPLPQFSVGLQSSLLVCRVLCWFAEFSVGLQSSLLVCRVLCWFAEFSVGLQSSLSVCKVLCRFAKFSVGLQSSLLVCRVLCWFAEFSVGLQSSLLVCRVLCWFAEFSVADGLRPSDLKILLRQVLMTVWIFFSVAAIVLHVSAPYSRADFSVVLMILILMLMVRLGEAQMFFIERKVALALPILTFALGSAPAPPPPFRLSTMLPWLVKFVTSSSASPSSVMGVVLTAALFLRTLLLP